LDFLPLESQDIHRASLTALTNLVGTQSHLCKQVVMDEKSLVRLCSLMTGSETHQVVRECARLFAVCAQNLGPDLLTTMPATHKPQFHQSLQRLSEHSDVHCRQHANQIHKALQVINA